MRLWRISSFADLVGTGGLLASGRWHSRGRPIVYLTAHPAAALLEVLVHLEVGKEDLPVSYQLLAVDFPDDIKFEIVGSESLPANWWENIETTRALGTRWLAAGQTALLRVPSAVVPFTKNWLLNPIHHDAARAAIAETIRAPFDPRLLG